MESVQGLVNLVKACRQELDVRIESMVDEYIKQVAIILKEELKENPHYAYNSYFAVPLGHLDFSTGSFDTKHTVHWELDKEYILKSFKDTMSEEMTGDYPGYEEYVGYELMSFLQALKNRGFCYIGVDNDSDNYDHPILPFFEV